MPKAYPYMGVRWSYADGEDPPDDIVAPVAGWTDPPVNMYVSGAATALGSVAVTFCSPDGTILTGFTGNVTVSLTGGDPDATFGGTKTVAAVAGVATFTDLTIDLPGAGYYLTATSATNGVTWDSQTWTVAATSNGFAMVSNSPESVYFYKSPAACYQPDPADVPDRTVLYPQPVVFVVPANETLVTDYTNVTGTLSIYSGPVGATLYGDLTVDGVLDSNLDFTGSVAWSDISVDLPGTYQLQAIVSLDLGTETIVESALSSVFKVGARTGTAETTPSGVQAQTSSVSFAVSVNPKSDIPAPPASGTYREDLSTLMDGVLDDFTFPTRVIPRSASVMRVFFNGIELAPATCSLSGNVLSVDWSLCNGGVAGNYSSGSGDRLVCEFPYYLSAP